MQISSYKLAEISEYLEKKLQNIRKKVKFYGDEEVKKRQGSNFSLEIPEQQDVFLVKFARVLRENSNIMIDTELANWVIENYKISKDKFSEFDNLLDEIYGKTNGSFDDVFFIYLFQIGSMNFTKTLNHYI